MNKLLETAVLVKSNEIKFSYVPTVYHVKGSDISIICLNNPTNSFGGLVCWNSRDPLPENLFIQLLDTFKPAPNNSLHVKIVGNEKTIKLMREFTKQHNLKIQGQFLIESNDLEAYYHTENGKLRVKKETDPIHLDTHKKIKVLIVDDSKVIRKILREILSTDNEIHIVGETGHPLQVESMLQELKPDVMTLDIHMPEMNGVTLIEKLFQKTPIPTVLVSSLSMEDGDLVLRALRLGAVDYIQKPSWNELREITPLIIEKVKAASKVIVAKKTPPNIEIKNSDKIISDLDKSLIIGIGASTGGTRAIEHILAQLPKDIPPIVIVQHIPTLFSDAFAKHLNRICSFEVKEATDRDEIIHNRVLIAPGGKQMSVIKSAGTFRVHITNDPPVNRHQPSVDVLFSSLAHIVGKQALGIILTGMGSDGAAGLLEMRKAGSFTIAEDESSCIVFGMPRAAITKGAVVQVCPLNEIVQLLLEKFSTNKKSA
ncbi:MAG: chemotaxis response regulator protein-glutamate methylesterase [Oligoflexia bacterium]|nr:chemotaxis response regulator protein-glutamate methylesterase [Oligoflexia bacterium]